MKISLTYRDYAHKLFQPLLILGSISTPFCIPESPFHRNTHIVDKESKWLKLLLKISDLVTVQWFIMDKKITFTSWPD